MKEWLLQYLVFSKKERLGLIVLFVLIGSVWLLPVFFGNKDLLSEKTLKQADSIRLSRVETDSGSIKIFELFPFDPNLLDARGWEKLGLRPKTIGIIQNYLSKGGRFRKASDLEKIYGLRADEAARLMPYVQIKNEQRTSYEYPSSMRNKDASYRQYSNNSFKKYQDKKRYPYKENPDSLKSFYKSARKARPRYQPFDINAADTTMFIALPGIGQKLASRIIQFREKLGGFYKIEQVAEVYGLQDTIYQLIHPYLLLSDPVLRKIDINNIGFDSLNAHPYIQFLEARAIIAYRKQHGSFTEINQLLNINILSREWLDKLHPYLELGPD